MRMDIEELGRRTFELRKRMHWNQDKLAERAKVAQATISRIEKGSIKQPSAVLLEKLADAFGLTISEFLGQQSYETDPLIREAVVVMQPMSDLEKEYALQAVKGIASAGKRKAG